MKIAFASSDGILVNRHFGQADTFYVFQIDKEVKFLEKRTGRPFCHGGEHDEGDLLDAVELLSDCSEVYVLEIGGGAEGALLQRGIKPERCRGFIEEIVLRRATEKQ